MSKKRLVTVLILLLFVALRLWRLTSYGLYGDETFGAQLAEGSWRELLAAVIQDVVHPPLFYILLKLWIAVFGDALLAWKLCPVFFAIASIVPLLALCRELRLTAAATNLFLWLMGVNAYFVIYAQELRMYSLVLLASSCSIWLFIKLLNASRQTGKIQIALFFANLVLVYSHYFGWLIIAMQLVLLLVWQRQKLKDFAIAGVLLAACFSPWAYLVAQAAKMKGGLAANLYWNPRPGVKDFFWYFINLNGAISYRWEGYGFVYKILLGVYPLFILFLIYAMVWYGKKVWSAALMRKNGQANLLPEGDTSTLTSVSLTAICLFAFAPPAMAFVASYGLSESVWGMRFLILSAPSYLLFLSLAVSNLESQKLRQFGVSLLVVWIGLSGYTELAHRDKLNVETLVKQMMGAESLREGHVKVYTDNGLVGNTMQFYLDHFHEQRFAITYVDSFDAIADEHYWVAFLKYRFDNHSLIQDDMAARGLQIENLFKTESSGHAVFLFAARN